MSFEYIRDDVIPAAYELLPPAMNSPESDAMLLAIGLQESRLEHRRQIGGPAMGFWQFESGGGWRGVLRHTSTRDTAAHVLRVMGYSADPGYEVLATNDRLACCFARLLLWTHPGPLPTKGQHDYAWDYYMNLWRPGKPHRETWDAFYDKAWGDS